jgi:hypothetical protein
MSAAWSVEQQRCLAALGYTLYRPAPPLAAAAVLAAPASSTSAKDVAAAIDPLLRALLRAANRDHAQVGDAQGWLRAQQVPSLARLRNDPAAKRALWPRLRASRRERGQP